MKKTEKSRGQQQQRKSLFSKAKHKSSCQLLAGIMLLFWESLNLVPSGLAEENRILSSLLPIAVQHTACCYGSATPSLPLWLSSILSFSPGQSHAVTLQLLRQQLSGSFLQSKGISQGRGDSQNNRGKWLQHHFILERPYLHSHWHTCKKNKWKYPKILSTWSFSKQSGISVRTPHFTLQLYHFLIMSF